MAFYANYVPYIGIKLFSSLSVIEHGKSVQDTNTQTHMDSVHGTHTFLNITRRHHGADIDMGGNVLMNVLF